MASTTLQVLCFVAVCSSVDGSRKRVSNKKLDTANEIQSRTSEIISQLLAAPCTYAISHATKHIGFTWGKGINVFEPVQEQLNALSSACSQQTNTEADIMMLETNVAKHGENLPTLEAEQTAAEAALQQFEDANSDLTEEECAAALSRGNKFKSWFKKSSHFFSDFGHKVSGWFTKDKEGHEKKHQATLASRNDEEAAIEAQKEVAKSCNEKNDLTITVKNAGNAISASKAKAAADTASLAEKQGSLPAIQDSIKTSQEKVLEGIHKLDKDITSQWSNAANDDPFANA